MLGNFSVSRKLFLMLLAPALGLVFFAALQILQKSDAVEDMETLTNLVAASLEISDLVHEMQVERGLSVGYLNSKGAEFGSELTASRQRTDTALGELQALLEGESANDLPMDVRKAIAGRIDALNTLGQLRNQISSQTISGEKALEAYSAQNNEGLSLIVGIAKQTNNPGLKNSLVAFANLLYEKEHAGIERAVVTGILANDRFAGDDNAAFIRALSEQESRHEDFRRFAEDQEYKVYRANVLGQSVDDVGRVRKILSNRETNFGADPKEWFASATSRIDLLKKVSDELTEMVVAEAGNEAEKAQSALLFYAVIGTLTLGLAVWFAYVVGRSINVPLTKASDDTRETSSQILAAVQQQSASSNETATAVSQTSTTVDEIRRTSEMTVNKAQAVQDVSDRSRIAAQEGATAIGQGIEAMRRIRDEVEGIARNILELSEKNLQIGEIVQSVNALAEQSNLLAVNASIEAAKAGEHGKGFAVVAGEVKALAEQSKDATVQIRAILAEIQKSSNAAVMVTEQGTKRVEEGTRLIEELGRTIDSISQVNEESADAASQISSAANQQLAGIEQITSAMRNIEQAVKDNAAGIHQLEQSARGLKSVSDSLGSVIKGSQAVHV